jgi:hypothetical protein
MTTPPYLWAGLQGEWLFRFTNRSGLAVAKKETASSLRISGMHLCAVEMREQDFAGSLRKAINRLYPYVMEKTGASQG